MDVKKLIEDVLIDLSDNKSLTDVASKIQIIVRLLGDDELKAWYDCEFVKGYHEEDLPAYRVTMAADIKADILVPQGFNFLHFSNQSIPVANLGFEKYDQIMTIYLKETIASIIDYSKQPERLIMSLNPYERVLAQKVLGNAQIQSIHKVIPPSAYQTIIDCVRSHIIDLFIDLDNRVFNGQLDINSTVGKEQIHQVITNNFTAGIIQTGSGKIDTTNSTVTASINGSLPDDIKAQILGLADEIERVAKEADEEFDEIAESIVAIKSELASDTPRLIAIKNAFKAIAWSASIACKTTIEELVKKAISFLG